MSAFSLQDLVAIVKARRNETAEKSYTRSLFEAGPPRMAKKFGEEAVETVIAALQNDRAALISESADVLYHLIVLLEGAGVELSEVLAELERRTGQSGHAEKASRGAK